MERGWKAPTNNSAGAAIYIHVTAQEPADGKKVIQWACFKRILTSFWYLFFKSIVINYQNYQMLLSENLIYQQTMKTWISRRCLLPEYTMAI